jgi:hypothetical protein
MHARPCPHSPAELMLGDPDKARGDIAAICRERLDLIFVKPCYHAASKSKAFQTLIALNCFTTCCEK